jgi:hypothetical protein
MSELKLYFGLAGAAIVLAAFTWWSVHERGIEHKKDVAADNIALAVRHTEVVKQTAANIAKADAADSGADHDQQVIDAYVAAHPSQPVRLCVSTGNSGQRGPANQTANGGAQGSGPGSAAVREVQDGAAQPGPDIGTGLDELVLSAARVATLYRDEQLRQ